MVDAKEDETAKPGDLAVESNGEPGVEAQKVNDESFDAQQDAESTKNEGSDDAETVTDENKVGVTEDKLPSISVHDKGSNDDQETQAFDNNLENQDNEAEEPHTSFLQPHTSANNQFYTPSKSLPPLKDIDHISTPKSFDVAKDTDEVTSSPIVEKTPARVFNANESFDNENTTVAAFLDIDVPSLLQTGNKDLIQTLHRKTAEFEKLKSENAFLKLNQEQTIQIQSKKFKVVQGKLETVTERVMELDSKNNELSSQLDSSKNLVNQLKSSNDQLTEELSLYKRKQDKGTTDYTNIISEKDEEIFKLNDSNNNLTSKNIQQNQKLNELNKEINDITNEKFTLQLQMTKSNNEATYLREQKDWYESELRTLQTKFTDLLKKQESDYLSSQNNISSLTNQNESLTKLKIRYEEDVKDLKNKLESEISKFSSLESKYEIEKFKVTKELKSKDEYLELLKVQSEQKSERISQLEEYVEEIKSKLSDDINRLESALGKKTETIVILEEKIKRTEDALDEELHKETELPKLSKSSELIASEGISLSTLYSEFNHLKKQLVLEKSQKDKLAKQLQLFVEELESKKPAISNYQDQIRFYENTMKEMISKVETIRIEKTEAEKSANKLRSKISDQENELVSMKKLCKDIGQQLCYYLIHSKIRSENEGPLSNDERKAIENILARSGNNDDTNESDTDQLISDRLVTFTSIVELQKKNEELLTVVRQLGRQLETKEKENYSIESVAIEEAKDAIITLDEEMEGLKVKLDAVTKERDMLKSVTNSSDNNSSNKEVKYLYDANSDLKSKLEQTEKLLKELKEESSKTIKSLNDSFKVASDEKNEFCLKITNLQHSLSLNEARYSSVNKSLDHSKEEILQLRKDIDFWKNQASKQENALINRLNELRDLESEIMRYKIAVKNLETEREVKESFNNELKEDMEQLKSDKANLNKFVINLQSLLKDRDESSKNLSARLDKSIENYQNLQEKLNEKEEKITILSSQSEMALKAQNTKLEQVNDLSNSLLEAKNNLAKKSEMITSLNSRIKELQNSMSRPRNLVSIDATNGDDSKLAIEYEQLQQDLRIAESQVTEYSTLAKSAEEALKSAMGSFDSYKADSETKFDDVLREKVALEKEVSSLKESISEQQGEIKLIKERHQNSVRKLEEQISELSSKAHAYDNLKSDYESKFETIQKDLFIQSKIADDNQFKYRQESEKNEQLTKELVELKEQITNLESETQRLTQEVTLTKDSLSGRDDEVSRVRQEYENELNNLNSKLKDLQEQNSIVLNQLELSKVDFTSGDSKDLKEVIAYLRKEKDFSEAKLLSSSEDISKLQKRLDQVTTELEITKTSLLKAQKASVNIDETSKEHKRLMEQVQQLNILRESNSSLREEIQRKSEKITQLEGELDNVSKSINPLKTKVEQLTSDIEEKDQSLKLNGEEIDRLKNSINSSTPESDKEYETLKQKYNSMREKANSRIQSQNDRIKELQTTITSLKEQMSELESSPKDLPSKEEVEATQKSLVESKEKAEKTISELISVKDTLNEEVTSLKNKIADLESKAQHDLALPEGSEQVIEEHKARIQAEFKNEFDNKVKEELNKHTLSDEQANNIRHEVQAQYEKQIESLKQDLQNEKEKLDTEYSEKLATETARNAQQISNTDGIDNAVKSAVEAREIEFAKTLEHEKQEIEKKIVKKYELKLKLLSKKLEKLDAKTESQRVSDETPANAPQPSPQLPRNSSTKPIPSLNHPYNESTLKVVRPSVDRADANEKKRSSPQPQLASKRPKDEKTNQ